MWPCAAWIVPIQSISMAQCSGTATSGSAWRWVATIGTIFHITIQWKGDGHMSRPALQESESSGQFCFGIWTGAGQTVWDLKIIHVPGINVLILIISNYCAKCRLPSPLCPPCTTCTGSWRWSTGTWSRPTSSRTKRDRSSSVILASPLTSSTPLPKPAMQVKWAWYVDSNQRLPHQGPAGTWLLKELILREVLVHLMESRLMSGVSGSPFLRWLFHQRSMKSPLHHVNHLFCFQVAEGSFPYPSWHTPFEQLRLVVEGPAPTPTPGRFSPKFTQFVNICLQKSVDERAGYDDLLQHPFILEREDNVDIGGLVHRTLHQWFRIHRKRPSNVPCIQMLFCQG